MPASGQSPRTVEDEDRERKMRMEVVEPADLRLYQTGRFVADGHKRAWHGESQADGSLTEHFFHNTGSRERDEQCSKNASPKHMKTRALAKLVCIDDKEQRFKMAVRPLYEAASRRHDLQLAAVGSCPWWTFLEEAGRKADGPEIKPEDARTQDDRWGRASRSSEGEQAEQVVHGLMQRGLQPDGDQEGGVGPHGQEKEEAGWAGTARAASWGTWQNSSGGTQRLSREGAVAIWSTLAVTSGRKMSLGSWRREGVNSTTDSRSSVDLAYKILWRRWTQATSATLIPCV